MNSILRKFRPVAAAALLSVAAALAGCEGWGLMADRLSGPPKVDARYELTKAPVVLLVETSPTARDTPAQATLRYRVHDELAKQLRDNKVNTRIVPAEEVRRVQASSATSSQWTPETLGSKLNATEVLHVTIEPYATSPIIAATDPTQQSRMIAFVKVVDCESGELRFPLEAEGEQVVFELKTQRALTGEPDRELTNELAVGLADRIAKLFYRHSQTDEEAFQARTRGPM